MKIPSLVFVASPLKTLRYIFCISAVLCTFNICNAQTIIGKWHRGGTKIFVTDKATGSQKPLSTEQQKKFDQAAAANQYDEVLEFRSDNTYVDKVSAKGREPMQHTQKYSLSGNKLEMNIPPVKNEKTTITIKSIDAHTMIWDLLFMGQLTEVIYTKL